MSSVERFRNQLRGYPVLAVVYGEQPLAAFIKSQSRVAFVANINLFQLKDVAARISANGKLVIANIDAIPGLAPDKVGLEYLTSIGIRAVATKRPSLIPRIKEAGSLAFQKVYITNRSNLPAMAKQIEKTGADIVQVQPAPILEVLTPEERASLKEFIGAGFIQNAEEARHALAHGAFAVSTRSEELWSGFTL